MTENKVSWKAEALDWAKSIAIAVAIGLFIKTFIFNTTYVDGHSMNPTLHNGDRLITAKIVYYFGEPEVGDIVVLNAPDRDDADYIKRIIGAPGDEILIQDGKIYRNGTALEEPYIEKDIHTYGEYVEGETIKVPEDKYFVVGDNRVRGASKDSRYFKSVDKELIKSKAVFRYYPFNNMGSVQ